MTRAFSLVLPVYQQADHIAQVVEGFTAAIGALGITHEIILVPNGCTDRSEDICRDLARTIPSVRCLTTPSRGWGHAVRLGIDSIDPVAGELIGYTNSARTQPDDLVSVLAAALANPAAVTKAARHTRASPVRRIGSWLYNWQCRVLFGIQARDINGTPKIFAATKTPLRALRRVDDLLDLELLKICHRHSYPVLEVRIDEGRRHGGRSTTRWRTALRLYSGAIRMWLEDR
ncbi:MAG: glycosyltransferase [Azospirillaceae bacterium]|nr:glycosyltransferase [Azospirillaceae bacterium]